MTQAKHSDENYVTEYNLESYWKSLLMKSQELMYKVVTCNESFHVTDSLPKCFVVPASLTAKDILDMSNKFINNRCPFWTYSHTLTGTSLIRMSYKAPGVDDNIEERVYNSIRQCHPSREYPRLFDLNLELSSPEDIRNAYSSIRQMCLYDSVGASTSWIGDQNSKWLSQLELSHWMEMNSSCLNLAKVVAEVMAFKKLSVVLKEYTSNDLSPLISSLVQLMLESECRTITGFQELVKKEWVATGFKFASRNGSKYFSRSNNQQSPIFMLFLDCVHQMLTMKPTEFQFNNHYLISIWNSICCGYFRDFLFDSPKESYYSILKANMDIGTGRNGSRVMRKHSNVGLSPSGTLTRKGGVDSEVDGTLLRKSQLDFTAFKKHLKMTGNKALLQSPMVMDSNYFTMNDVDSYTLKSSRSHFSKLSLISLNSSKSYSTNSTPFSKKQQFFQPNQQHQNGFANSLELSNLGTLRKSSLSQQKLSANNYQDDRSSTSYDNPWTDLIGQVSKEGTYKLFDWSVVLDASDYKFQNILYKKWLNKIPTTIETATEKSNQIMQNVKYDDAGQIGSVISKQQKSALILNGLKFYNYSSVYPDVKSSDFAFHMCIFTVPFLRFWSECYLQFHPVHNRNVLLRNLKDVQKDTNFNTLTRNTCFESFEVFFNLIQRIQHLEKCLLKPL